MLAEYSKSFKVLSLSIQLCKRNVIKSFFLDVSIVQMIVVLSNKDNIYSFKSSYQKYAEIKLLWEESRETLQEKT